MNVPKSCKLCSNRRRRVCRQNSIMRGTRACELVLGWKRKELKKRGII